MKYFYIILALVAAFTLGYCSHKEKDIIPTEDIEELRKENDSLYQLAKELGADRVIEVETVIEHTTDTVFIQTETRPQSNIDSTEYKVFTYENKNDSVQYKLQLYQKEQPLWYIINCSHKNKIDIFEKDGNVIPTQGQEVKIYGKKKKFIEHLNVQPQIGLGYGLFNNKFDIYVGFGVTYKF